MSKSAKAAAASDVPLAPPVLSWTELTARDPPPMEVVRIAGDLQREVLEYLEMDKRQRHEAWTAIMPGTLAAPADNQVMGAMEEGDVMTFGPEAQAAVISHLQASARASHRAATFLEQSGEVFDSFPDTDALKKAMQTASGMLQAIMRSVSDMYDSLEADSKLRFRVRQALKASKKAEALCEGARKGQVRAVVLKRVYKTLHGKDDKKRLQEAPPTEPLSEEEVDFEPPTPAEDGELRRAHHRSEHRSSKPPSPSKETRTTKRYRVSHASK